MPAAPCRTVDGRNSDRRWGVRGSVFHDLKEEPRQIISASRSEHLRDQGNGRGINPQRCRVLP